MLSDVGNFAFSFSDISCFALITSSSQFLRVHFFSFLFSFNCLGFHVGIRVLTRLQFLTCRMNLLFAGTSTPALLEELKHHPAAGGIDL